MRTGALAVIGITTIAVTVFLQGCGTLKQMYSRDLTILVERFGAATVPGDEHRIVWDGPLDDAIFAEAFPYVERYGGVTKMEFNGRAISDASVPLLLRLRGLEELHLQGTNLTLVGLRQLSGLPRLRWVVVEAGRFTPADLADLRSSVPNVKVDETVLVFPQRPRAGG
jgi:hypothetical protein